MLPQGEGAVDERRLMSVVGLGLLEPQARRGAKTDGEACGLTSRVGSGYGIGPTSDGG